MSAPEDVPLLEAAVHELGAAAAELCRPEALAALSLGEAAQAERLGTAAMVELMRLFGQAFVLERMRPRKRSRRAAR